MDGSGGARRCQGVTTKYATGSRTAEIIELNRPIVRIRDTSSGSSTPATDAGEYANASDIPAATTSAVPEAPRALRWPLDLPITSQKIYVQTTRHS
ncbi:hypothetical protein ACIBD9_08590 [Micromonospora sp. NPDC050784]|uniref:hypothetical protein n=1 Tax=Micromonospora sp. NPDC050784 TaxID=3364281 RepID=UPI0037952F7A